MFKEEETQYCPMCQEWAEKYDQLKAEIEEQKRQLKVKANILKLINEAKNNYKQALQEIEEIAKNACCNQPTSTCEEFKNCEECGRESVRK